MAVDLLPIYFSFYSTHLFWVIAVISWFPDCLKIKEIEMLDVKHHIFVSTIHSANILICEQTVSFWPPVAFDSLELQPLQGGRK